MPTCTAFGVKSRINVPSSVPPPLVPPQAGRDSAAAKSSARSRRTRPSLAYHRARSNPDCLGGPVEASRRTAAYSGTTETHRELERRGPEAYAAELIGTLLLVFFIGAIVTLHTTDPAGLGYQDWAVIG